MTNDALLTVKVWGDFALFTRPEFSAERVSYQVMTPSAARGILEAIFWKPEMSWQVHEIHVLKPIRHFSIVRNEINHHQLESRAKDWAENGLGNYYATEMENPKNRTQRHSLCLRDVAYIIKANILTKPHTADNVAKYRDQFRRRVKRGQCFHQPYLGTREFSASFGEPEEGDRAINLTDDLGLMLFDMEFKEAESKGTLAYMTHDTNGVKIVKGTAQPKFFKAQLDAGVLIIPTHLYR
jgi:CRISPR-associated protein Cas5d